MDEATSALDPKSEKEVQAAINKISKESNAGSKLTIIIIAHRLSTIEHADNLIYFKNKNEIIRYGKGSDEFQELLNKLKNDNVSDSGSSGSSSPEFLTHMLQNDDDIDFQENEKTYEEPLLNSSNIPTSNERKYTTKSRAVTFQKTMNSGHDKVHPVSMLHSSYR